MQEKSVGAKGKNGKRIPILQEKSGGAKGKTDTKFPVWFDNSIGYRGKTNEKIPVWLEKVRHGRKIPAYRGGKHRMKFRSGWKNSDMVGKLHRMEGGKFRYCGNFPSTGKKRCSVTQTIQYCGTRRICGDLPPPFLSVWWSLVSQTRPTKNLYAF